VIVDAAESTDADHIVMGSHGRSGLSGALIGSVAESVVQSAPVSVTVSRP
jgi:nucleotide-binding universal stress UspA family protein